MNHSCPSLLHPQGYLSSHNTLPVTDEEAGARPPGRASSFSSATNGTRPPASSEVASQTSTNASSNPSSSLDAFFSRTPDDIRASTVQISMLTLHPPRPPHAHSYLSSGGPASFPLHPPWSPPRDTNSEHNPSRTSGPDVPVNPRQIRTPVTAADLAVLNQRASALAPAFQQSHDGGSEDEESSNKVRIFSPSP